jgi:hypothetical protein
LTPPVQSRHVKVAALLHALCGWTQFPNYTLEVQERTNLPNSRAGLYYPSDTMGTVPRVYDIFRVHEEMEGIKINIKMKNGKIQHKTSNILFFKK